MRSIIIDYLVVKSSFVFLGFQAQSVLGIALIPPSTYSDTSILQVNLSLLLDALAWIHRFLSRVSLLGLLPVTPYEFKRNFTP